ERLLHVRLALGGDGDGDGVLGGVYRLHAAGNTPAFRSDTPHHLPVGGQLQVNHRVRGQVGETCSPGRLGLVDRLAVVDGQPDVLGDGEGLVHRRLALRQGDGRGDGVVGRVHRLQGTLDGRSFRPDPGDLPVRGQSEGDGGPLTQVSQFALAEAELVAR